MGATITSVEPWIDYRKDGSQVRMLKVRYVTDKGYEDDVDVEKDTATKDTIAAAIKADMAVADSLKGAKV